MAKLDAMNALKIQKDQVDGILQAGRKEDAQTFLDTWRLNNLGTKDSGALPPVDAVPPHLRGWIFRKAEASPQDGMKIANFMGLSGQGTTLSEDEYWRGYDTIMETTIDGSDDQIKRLNILWHQFNDQVSNPKDGLKIAQNFSPADVPLGDGMIYDAKTKMQKNLKQKYDLMLQEGFIDEVEYKKQMDRHFGTKGKK